MREEITQRIDASPPNQVNLEEMAIKDSEIQEIIDLILLTKPHTQSIFLNHNLIGDAGAMMLQKGLAPLSKLDYLDLQFNLIDKDGAFALMCLKCSRKQLEIALHGNKINNAAEMQEIESAAKAAKDD